MANVNNPKGFKAVKMLGGGAIPTFPAYTTSNLALAAGDAIVMLTNGTVTRALLSTTSVYGVCESGVTASAGVRKEILFTPAADNIVFAAQYGSTSLTATTQNFGVAHDINGASGAMVLTATATSGRVAVPHRLEPTIGNSVGQYERVLFTWKNSQWTGQA